MTEEKKKEMECLINMILFDHKTHIKKKAGQKQLKRHQSRMIWNDCKKERIP